MEKSNAQTTKEMIPGPSIVILAKGRFPKEKHCLEILDNADKIICCDGAAENLLNYGMEPDLIIGDLDSLRPELKSKYAGILIHNPDQESNDQTKAVRYCIEKAYKSVTILGATGMREDHTIGNISLLSEYCTEINARIVTDYGEFFIPKSGEIISSFPGESISVFSTDSSLIVSSQGLKYELDNLLMANWRTATLNESLGKEFTLFFEAEGKVIVFAAK